MSHTVTQQARRYDHLYDPMYTSSEQHGAGAGGGARADTGAVSGDIDMVEVDSSERRDETSVTGWGGLRGSPSETWPTGPPWHPQALWRCAVHKDVWSYSGAPTRITTGDYRPG